MPFKRCFYTFQHIFRPVLALVFLFFIEFISSIFLSSSSAATHDAFSPLTAEPFDILRVTKFGMMHIDDLRVDLEDQGHGSKDKVIRSPKRDLKQVNIILIEACALCQY